MNIVYKYMMQIKKQDNHPHILAKELMQKIRMNSQQFRLLLKERTIDYYHLTQQQRKKHLYQVIQEFRKTQKGQLLSDHVVTQLQEQANLVSNSQVKRNGYLIDCFRQATAFPIAKEREHPSFCLTHLHGKDIKKELRRVVWSRLFNIDKFRMRFMRWDREVTPFKIHQQLKISLQKTSVRHKTSLKDNQIDNAIRIIQYFLKAEGKLPPIYLFDIVAVLVDLYSYTKVAKITQLGAVSLGVIDLLDSYSEDTENKLQNIKQALHIVDQQTFKFIESKYLQTQQKQLLESFQLFRLTAGSYYLPLQTSQFIIDQLLIRRKNNLDIYTLFAIMILIISDEFQPKYSQGWSLKQIIQSARTIIKKEDFFEAYNVIYEHIPAMFSSDDLAQHPNSQLLAAMLSIQKIQASQQQMEDEGFVVDIPKTIRISTSK